MSNPEEILSQLEDELPPEDLELAPEIDGGEETPEVTEQTGWMDHAQWVDAGKDPDKFRGRKAFDDYGDQKNEMKELKSTLDSVLEVTGTLKTQYQQEANDKVERAMIDAQAALAEADANDDVKAALSAQKEINKLETKVVPEQSAAPLPAITDFLHKNPILDKSNPQFDAAFYQDWAMMHDSTLDSLLGGNRDRQNELTQDQVDRSMNFAIRKAKELHSEKFVSPRNSRAATPPRAKARAATSTDYISRLKALGGNDMNSNDGTAALDMYKLLVKKNNGDKKIADTYAKNLLGDK